MDKKQQLIRIAKELEVIEAAFTRAREEGLAPCYAHRISFRSEIPQAWYNNSAKEWSTILNSLYKHMGSEYEEHTTRWMIIYIEPEDRFADYPEITAISSTEDDNGWHRVRRLMAVLGKEAIPAMRAASESTFQDEEDQYDIIVLESMFGATPEVINTENLISMPTHEFELEATGEIFENPLQVVIHSFIYDLATCSELLCRRLVTGFYQVAIMEPSSTESSDDDADPFWPVADFPAGVAGRLRHATDPKRKGKRVRSKKIDGTKYYSVNDASAHWPSEMQTHLKNMET